MLPRIVTNKLNVFFLSSLTLLLYKTPTNLFIVFFYFLLLHGKNVCSEDYAPFPKKKSRGKHTRIHILNSLSFPVPGWRSTTVY